MSNQNFTPSFSAKLLALMITSTLPLIAHAQISKENPLKKSWSCSAQKNGKWYCYETENHTQLLFSQEALSSTQRQQVVAKALGWISDAKSACGGYYFKPGGYANPDTPLGKTSINFAKADVRPQGTIMVSGGVEVSRGQQYISAQQATLSANPKTKKVQTLSAEGDVNLSQPGQLIISKSIQTDLNSHTAALQDTYYLLKVNQNMGGSATSSITHDNNFTGFARGQAKKIEQQDQNHFVLKDATYTTDTPYSNDWELSSSTLEFNKSSGFGQAYNSILKVQGVPVFYWPYLAFPINEKRKSGFLYPEAGYMSRSGYYYSQPYYLNLAPNYDLTLTPTYYTSRGFMLGSKFRYLTTHNQGTAMVNYIPYDTELKKGRAYLGLQDHGQYTYNFSSDINYNYVTDDNYYRDFNSDNIFANNQTLLTQQGSLNYITPNWSLTGTVLNYQTLDPNITLGNEPYSTLPQINFTSGFPNSLPYLNYGLDGQFTYFYKGPNSGIRQVNGQRLFFEPYLSLPLQSTWGSITPKIALAQTDYWLQNTQSVNNVNGFNQAFYPDNNINRTLPMFNIGAKLSFDRAFTLDQHQYVQTLTPRVFYNYIPYRNQSNIPLFDTAFTNFTYDSLFQENRFTGYDRINNANQLSYALETQINDKNSGQMILSAGIGQMIYFQKQRVGLCRQAGCVDQENPWAENTLSDVAGFINYQLFSGWYLKSNLSFNPNNGNVDNQKYGIQYMPDENHIFNISYQNITNDFALLTPEAIENNTGGVATAPSVSQISTSALWKLTSHWSAVGLWNYDFNSSRTLNMFAGLQYDACSWAFRFLAQRYVTVTNNGQDPSNITGPYTNAFVVQIQLKGLGGIGSGDLSAPLSIIPGYQS